MRVCCTGGAGGEGALGREIVVALLIAAAVLPLEFVKEAPVRAWPDCKGTAARLDLVNQPH